jgi:hypothetical protein
VQAGGKRGTASEQSSKLSRRERHGEQSPGLFKHELIIFLVALDRYRENENQLLCQIFRSLRLSPSRPSTCYANLTRFQCRVLNLFNAAKAYTVLSL